MLLHGKRDVIGMAADPVPPNQRLGAVARRDDHGGRHAGDATADPMTRLDSVEKRYPGGTVAVHELSLDVPEGELCVLVGPSGCGKTTTLKMINRLIEPTRGRIHLAGEDVTTA